MWVDEEEEKIIVNLAKVNRLRKMRKKEDEIVISGSEYVSRLRTQHIRLNPVTEWAPLGSQEIDCDEDSEDQNGEIEDGGDQGAKGINCVMQTNKGLVMKSREGCYLNFLNTRWPM